jgi:IS605 OrfB family transposase
VNTPTSEDHPTVTKTIRFWLGEVGDADFVLLHELSRELARCHRLFTQSSLEYVFAGGTNSTERLRLARRVYQEAFAESGFIRRFGNTYTGEWADKDFKRQWGLIQRGDKSSVSFGPGAHANIDVLTEGIQATIEHDDDGWWLCGLGIRLDDRVERQGRRWKLIPQTNGGAAVKAKQAARKLRQLESAERTSRVRLVWRDGKRTGGKKGWEAQVVCRMPVVASKPDEPTVCGVDVGMRCLLVASIPSKDRAKFIGGSAFGELWHEIKRHSTRRVVLNRDHKRHASAAHSDKCSRLRKHACELASRQLIDWCMLNRVTTIRLEDLSGIRDRCSEEGKTEQDRTWNLRLSHWPWYYLQQRIEQKAAAYGITVEKVNPHLTSQTCSSCGHVDSANREGAQFKCLRCGFERHADLNAANNIAKRGGVDFDTPNTPDRAAVRSDGPESRPKAGRSGRLAMPDNPVTLPVAL